jgi:hypothetical protein
MVDKSVEIVKFADFAKLLRLDPEDQPERLRLIIRREEELQDEVKAKREAFRMKRLIIRREEEL